ncbi:hypothetical protein OG884_18370 [Streptosporangium sp. NBC_01755]|uniref:hypothetical protein n=1 Tax=Streptosporangium sp. NBC_01755 TaxID=2975949 RepID=UPI002DDB3E81|nr:hypothetical protein [Streptosporangium sp. NBC_01755]WSD03772.1 hypothetical protein OG884_18370 [Streptosporangium sp. NBC_01755]
MKAVFTQFMEPLVTENAGRLLNDGPETQIPRAVEALEKFAKTTPLRRPGQR